MTRIIIRVGGKNLENRQWIEWEIYPRNESGGNIFHDDTKLERCEIWGHSKSHKPFRVKVSFAKMRKMIRALKKMEWRNANRKYLHIAYPDKY